ncbi:MAG: TldD/PmbA family protein [Deltaproteobacteria bacterium]|nr:MAG: TldD/PmbA family protein [Deltaproteobacteria bacterium]
MLVRHIAQLMVLGLALTSWSVAGRVEAAPAKATSRPVAAPKAAKKAAKPAKAAPKATKKLSAFDKEASTVKEWRDFLVSQLQRYWKILRKRKPPRVYYMRYEMQRARQVNVAARDGVIVTSSDNRKSPKHRLNVSVRVGNYKLDSSGNEGYDWKAFRSFIPVYGRLPAKLDQSSLRKMLWRMTDFQVRRHMAQYHRKRYVRSLKVEIKDKSGDFSKEPAVVLEQLPPVVTFAKKKWSRIVRNVSAFSLKNLRVIRSGIVVSASQDLRILVDSNGARVIRHKTLYKYTIQINYLSAKKNEVYTNYRVGYVDAESKLPSEKEFKELMRKTLQEVVDQGNAPEGEPVEAPAIVLPGVAGVLFHEALGHRLEAQRMLNEDDGRTFRKKIGKKVIPTFLSVYDDPTLKEWRGTPLNGHYLVDEQGVRTSRVTLIKDGILRGFLMSRKPIDKFKHSNGHGRGLFGRTPFSRMGNLLIKSQREYNLKKLKAMLLAEARRQGKPYAFIISRSSGGYTHTGSYGIQSFKNQPKVVLRIDVKTGKSRLVKGLEIIGTPLTVVNNIIATGKDYGVFNGVCGAESGWVPVSAIAPSVLLKTIELQRISITQRKFYKLAPPPALAPKAKKASKKAAKAAKKKPATKAKVAKPAKKDEKKAPAAKRPAPRKADK